MVNDRSVTEGVGKLEHMVWKPRSAEEMHRLEELAEAAVGFDARRGDQVVIQNVSFSTNVPEVKPPVMDKLMEELRGSLHTQPELLRTALIGICGVLLVLFVLRPVASQMSATLREPMLLAPRRLLGRCIRESVKRWLLSRKIGTRRRLLPRSKNKTYINCNRGSLSTCRSIFGGSLRAEYAIAGSLDRVD